MFPTANSQVYYNEDGEVLGWDTYPAEQDPYDYDYNHDDSFSPEECEHLNVSDISGAQGVCEDCYSAVTETSEGWTLG